VIREDVEQYMNQRVMITTVKDSKYIGTLNGIGHEKFHLMDLVICHKDGTGKTASGTRELNKRWFNLTSVKGMTTEF
jgi:hypothetical protein